MTTMDRRLPKNIEIAPNSLSIVLKPTTVDKEKPPKTGKALFQDLQNENKLNFWNRELSESVLQLNYLGWFEPDTLFIQGGDKEMSIVREAYARRVLKPPRHHTIQILGDVDVVELAPVPQSQFVPLTEVLCLIIAELNKRKIIATVEKIKGKLADCYGDVKLPSEEILKKSLAHLIKEQKVCHTGEGYFIVTPEDFLYLQSCASSIAASEVNTSPISQNSNQSGQSSEGQPRKPQKTVRMAVQISTEKGTHTKKKEPPSPRSKSLPPNLSHRDLKNGDSPVRNRSTSLQRSNSLREKKAQASKANNFQRAGSVRTPVTTTGTQMSNIGSDSDASRIADNCGNAFGFGKLFRKSFGKKGKKIDDNRKEKERDREKEKIKDKEKDAVDNKQNKDKKTDLLTFSAQFPPEDWPQVIQEMKRKGAVMKHDKNGGKYETSLVNHNGGSPKASPKKDHVVICDQVEHIPGPSTSKDRKVKVYRKKDDCEPLPESEAEFIIPTKMYDDKCRTKAVSEQLRKQYSRKHKEDPWKYLREKEGKAMKKNSEKEAAVNGVNGTRPKRTSAKERPKSDPRDMRLRSIAQIRTAEYVSKLPASKDVNDMQHWDDDMYHLDVDSSELTTSDNNRVLSHRAKGNLRSPIKVVADHDFESSDMTPSDDLRGRHVSRHYRAIKRDATKIIRDIQSRVDDTSDTFTSDQEDYATHHHQYHQRPRPKSDGYMLSGQQKDYYDTSTTMETTEQYDDDDYDDDRDCTTPPLPVSHDFLDLPLPDHPDVSLESSEGSVPLPDDEFNGHHTPPRLSPIKESQESQMSLDHAKASQQSLEGRAQQVRMETPNESPSMLSIETSDSAPSTVIGKDEISSAKEKSLLLPNESFSSSACDSGFNSPRGSIALSRHSNTPIEHMTYDQLREKRLSYCIPEGIELKDFETQKVSSHIPKSKHNSPDKEPSLIPIVSNGNQNGKSNGNGTTQIPSKPHTSKLGGTHSEMRVEKEISNRKEMAQPVRQHEALKVL